MSTSQGPPTENPQQHIIDRAANDPVFRDQLLRDPRQTVQSEIGIPLPASVTVRVVEEQPGEVVLVLPAGSLQPGSELSDDDLEAVAGGSTGWGGAQWGGECVG